MDITRLKGRGNHIRDGPREHRMLRSTWEARQESMAALTKQMHGSRMKYTELQESINCRDAVSTYVQPMGSQCVCTYTANEVADRLHRQTVHMTNNVVPVYHVPMYQCTIAWTNAPTDQCTMHVPMCQCTNAQCTNVLMHQCTNAVRVCCPTDETATRIINRIAWHSEVSSGRLCRWKCGPVECRLHCGGTSRHERWHCRSAGMNDECRMICAKSCWQMQPLMADRTAC
jgi:hypothetical protein